MKRILLFLFSVGGTLVFNAQTYIGNGITSYSCTLSPQTASTFLTRSAFAIDNFGNKWIGLNSGYNRPFELMRYNGTTWDSFPHVPSHKVNALAVDGSNNLWIGTDSGLVMYNGTSYTIYNTGNSALINNIVNCIEIGGGKIYIGTNGGLSILSGSSFTNYNTSGGMYSSAVYSLAYESSTSIWIGESGGLEKFNGSNFSYDSLGANGSDKINCIYIDQSGNKWLGTNSKGVIRYDNTSFKSMYQLYGPNAIVGALWPLYVKSICKGPNGGVSFIGNYLLMNTTYMPAGLIEVMPSGSLNLYKGVGTSSSLPGAYSMLEYDNGSNKVWFVPTSGQYPVRVFTYSFDKSQYTSPPLDISATNSDFLDINNVSALVTANADIGWDGASTKYFVPKTQVSSPLQTAALWIGGYSNGNLRLAAMTYRQNGTDFWPGPLDTTNATTDTSTAMQYNKVWKVDRFEIANFIYNWNAGNVQNGTFYPSNAILTWPAHGAGNISRRLAPFVDINGNGVYDPLVGGDYPLIRGDQMIWWVFNDSKQHSETGGAQFGMEIHASAYAFVCPGITDSNRVLNNTTFYNYKIFNRSQNTYDSCYVSNWMDTDLGNYQDDDLGCDVSNNFGYTINGDIYDEDHATYEGYHDFLPIFSCNVLNGPVAEPGDGRDNNNNGVIDEPGERNLLTSFIYYTNTSDAQTGNPSSASQYFNFMTGRWRNATPLTYGGSGTSSANPICHHLFPGNTDPYGVSLGGSISNPISPPGNFGTTGWTRQQAGVLPSDFRFVTGSGPFKMLPGSVNDYDFAYVFSQDSLNCYGDTTSPFCTFPRAQQDNIRVKHWFDTNTFPSCLSLNGVGIHENATPAIDVTLYPNPAHDQVFVSFKTAQNCTVEVIDLTGRIVTAAVFTDARTYHAIPVSSLAAGVYNVRIKTQEGSVVKKFIKE